MSGTELRRLWVPSHVKGSASVHRKQRPGAKEAGPRAVAARPRSWVSGWEAWMRSDVQRQMAIVFQHPVGLNASFEDGRLYRLLFSFRFYA